MNLFTLIEQVRSAQQVASAFENGKTPPARAMNVLGIPSEAGRIFKR